jgi:hypothetical protein
VLFQPPDPERAAAPTPAAGSATDGAEKTGSASPAAAPPAEPEMKVTGPEPSATAGTPKKAPARRSVSAKAAPAAKTTRKTPEAAPAKAVTKTTRKKAPPVRAAAEEAPAAATRDDPGPASGRTGAEGLRATAVRVLDQPGFAPELLALAAVRALGPRARDWARWHRDAYPAATSDGLARLATRRFVRLARAGGATAALAGAFAPVAELAAALWAQAGLVLHLAAAYGRNPADPERAVELLVLTGVHPDAAAARAALASAQAATGAIERPWPAVAAGARRLAAPLGAPAGGWLAVRLAARLVPGAGVLAGVAVGSAAAERLAARAIAAYRPDTGRSRADARQSQSNQDLGSRA